MINAESTNVYPGKSDLGRLSNCLHIRVRGLQYCSLSVPTLWVLSCDRGPLALSGRENKEALSPGDSQADPSAQLPLTSKGSQLPGRWACGKIRRWRSASSFYFRMLTKATAPWRWTQFSLSRGWLPDPLLFARGRSRRKRMRGD